MKKRLYATVAMPPRGMRGRITQAQRDSLTLISGTIVDAIKAGTKPEEFRLRTPFWRTRLEGKTFERVVLTLGYPSRNDTARRLVLPWRGLRETTITHPHFGPAPVEVYAINVQVNVADKRGARQGDSA